MLSILLPASCASLSARIAKLLAEDYRTMSDSQLQLYYRQLNDRLGPEASAALCLRLAGTTAEDPQVVALRARWNEVRGELRRRETVNERERVREIQTAYIGPG